MKLAPQQSLASVKTQKQVTAAGNLPAVSVAEAVRDQQGRPSFAPEEPPEVFAGLQESLRRLEQRDWWLWGASMLVMLVLALAVISLTLPVLVTQWEASEELTRTLAARGLLGLVLLFSVYTIYQQVLIHKFRRGMSEQIGVTAVAQARAEMLEKLAILDPLTGLYNRRFAAQHLKVEMARAERHGYPLTVLALDLNNLKRINDRFGHAAGDVALTEFSRRLRKAIRSSDIPTRMGGDEFLVILSECSSELVPRVLSRLRGLETQMAGETVPVTSSAGWAAYKSGDSVEQLLERADQALYADKMAGKSGAQPRGSEAGPGKEGDMPKEDNLTT